MADAPGNNDINFYAETNFRGQRKRFGIKRVDRRKHVYIIGKTGMGKSTVLENMTIQDIQAGRGVAVVDPHGEYAEKMLDFVPKERVDDVIYLNPADIAFPLAFNIMEVVAEDQRHFVSSGLLAVFKKIFGPEVWSARMEYILANAILALLEIPGSTLLSVNRMFGEKEFRRHIVSQLTDPVVKGFWENEFAKYPEQYMREAVGAIQNKVGQFSGNPLIRNVIGQTNTSFNMRRIMDEQKILIINLAKGKIGEENSRLLGAMIVTKLYLAAMSRVDILEPERKDFYLYVDEFQNFATESFANILSEARKYRLNLTVAHQYVLQMEEDVQHAIFGNVGTMIVFRVGAEDAELLEKEFMPEFTVQDIVNLGFKNIYTKLMIDGITSRPFSAETLAPFPPPAESFREAIIKSTRERYATPRAVVEEKIRSFTASAILPSPVAASPKAAAGPERQMYEAVCAVDGKKIMVPFKPDGSRPVYCEEHMDMVKFRSKGGPSDQRPKNTGSGPGHARPPKESAPPNSGGRGFEAAGANKHESQPFRKEVQLLELRKALEESMRPVAKPVVPASAPEVHLGQPVLSREKAPENAGRPQRRDGQGTLAPGEIIKFE